MDSAYAKYRRAQTHLAELQASVEEARAKDLSSEQTFHVTYPYGDDDPRAVVTLRLELSAPAEWSLMMGDILTNLRAALDHAVYGHGTGRQALNSQQRGSLSHPMSQASAEWDSTPDVTLPDGTVKPGRKGLRDTLGGMLDPAVLALIEQHQPFNAAGDPAWHTLAVLGALVNRDKHRAVLGVPINVAELALQGSNLEIISEGDLQPISDGVVEKEITVRRPLRAEGAGPHHRLGQIANSVGYLEEIDIPNTGQRRGFLFVMEELVKSIGEYLDELKAAGC